MKAPKNWRLLEIQSGRSPHGKPSKGLHGEIEERAPTREQWAALAHYTKLIRRDVDHETAMLAVYRVSDPQSVAIMQSLIARGLLVVG